MRDHKQNFSIWFDLIALVDYYLTYEASMERLMGSVVYQDIQPRQMRRLARALKNTKGFVDYNEYIYDRVAMTLVIRSLMREKGLKPRLKDLSRLVWKMMDYRDQKMHLTEAMRYKIDYDLIDLIGTAYGHGNEEGAYFAIIPHIFMARKWAMPMLMGAMSVFRDLNSYAPDYDERFSMSEAHDALVGRLLETD